MMDAVDAFTERKVSEDAEASKLARRHRIKTEYLKLAGTEWVADRDGDPAKEEEAFRVLKEVKRLRLSGVMAGHRHSDDIGEDSSEEGDDDEDDEKDEWEDEEEYLYEVSD